MADLTKNAQAAEQFDIDFSEDEFDGDLFVDADKAPANENDSKDEVSSDDEILDIDFNLDDIPGASDQSPFELEVEEEAPVEIDEDDPLGRGHAGYLGWLSKKMKNPPKHSGRDSAGLERCVEYFKGLDRTVSKALRSDSKGEIDSLKAEEAREQIHNAIERLEERLDTVMNSKYKKKKKAELNYSIVVNSDSYSKDEIIKEANKSTKVLGITICVDAIIARVARILINGMVSGGHDLEDMLKKLVKKYDFDKREQAVLLMCLEDFGYPVRRDRGFDLDEEIDPSSENGFDWSKQNPS